MGLTTTPDLSRLSAREREIYEAGVAARAAGSSDSSQTETVSARLALAFTAISPWLWNWYIAGNGWGPEMDAVIGSSMGVLIGVMLSRAAES